jgi:hypothetical protein
MNRSLPTPSALPDAEATDDLAFLDEQVRAMRALGILLDSKLIDEEEYERRALLHGNTEQA